MEDLREEESGSRRMSDASVESRPAKRTRMDIPASSVAKINAIRKREHLPPLDEEEIPLEHAKDMKLKADPKVSLKKLSLTPQVLASQAPPGKPHDPKSCTEYPGRLPCYTCLTKLKDIAEKNVEEYKLLYKQ